MLSNISLISACHTKWAIDMLYGILYHILGTYLNCQRPPKSSSTSPAQHIPANAAIPACSNPRSRNHSRERKLHGARQLEQSPSLQPKELWYYYMPVYDCISSLPLIIWLTIVERTSTRLYWEFADSHEIPWPHDRWLRAVLGVSPCKHLSCADLCNESAPILTWRTRQR